MSPEILSTQGSSMVAWDVTFDKATLKAIDSYREKELEELNLLGRSRSMPSLGCGFTLVCVFVCVPVCGGGCVWRRRW